MGDHPAWIPFATDSFGDYLAVDMAPGPNGRPGQVILIGRHQDRGPVYVADSVTELIRAHAEALRLRPASSETTTAGCGSTPATRYQHKRQYDDICTLKVSGWMPARSAG